MQTYQITKLGAELLKLPRNTKITVLVGNKPSPVLWKKIWQPKHTS